MHRIVSALIAAVLAAGLVVAAATPSGASVATKTSRFCKEVKDFDTESIGNPTTRKGARKSLPELRRLEEAAKGKTKRAMSEIVRAYERIADGDRARDVFSDGDVIKALARFALAVGGCFVNDLPDITLPDLD